MGTTSLFLISTLALLASSSADYCDSSWIGDLSGYPMPLSDTIVPTGVATLTIPDPCSQFGMDEVGVEVTACSVFEPAPVVKVQDFSIVLINSRHAARVSTIVFCQSRSKHALRHAADYNQQA